MIECDVLEQDIKAGKINNCYVFCGIDEKLIKESVNLIISKVLSPDFMELNLVKFDGNKTDINEVINACETLPFMADRKVVLMYRALFLGEKEDRENKKKLEDINKYVENLPSHCILIMYYVFVDEREKPSAGVKKLEKKCCVVKADKLKGDKLLAKVKKIFETRGKDIGKVELKFFCDSVENNMDIIFNEVNKLSDFTEGREITKSDITAMLPQKSDDDIFDLVDYVSQKRPEKALDILNQLVYRGENLMGILFMIQRQFKLLLSVKIGTEAGKGKDTIAKELRLHPFIAEKMIVQSRKFQLSQIKKCLQLCLNTEKTLKSSTFEKKTEMELLLIETVRVS